MKEEALKSVEKWTKDWGMSPDQIIGIIEIATGEQQEGDHEMKEAIINRRYELKEMEENGVDIYE